MSKFSYKLICIIFNRKKIIKFLFDFLKMSFLGLGNFLFSGFHSCEFVIKTIMLSQPNTPGEIISPI